MRVTGTHPLYLSDALYLTGALQSDLMFCFAQDNECCWCLSFEAVGL